MFKYVVTYYAYDMFSFSLINVLTDLPLPSLGTVRVRKEGKA